MIKMFEDFVNGSDVINFVNDLLLELNDDSILSSVILDDNDNIIKIFINESPYEEDFNGMIQNTIKYDYIIDEVLLKINEYLNSNNYYLDEIVMNIDDGMMYVGSEDTLLYMATDNHLLTYYDYSGKEKKYNLNLL